MKRFVFVGILFCIALMGFSRETILCDVVYEKSAGRWSNYYRTKVDFLRGSEMNVYGYDASKMFIIIWFSQTQCAVVKTDETLFPEFDFNSVYFLITGRDILNEGILGIQTNGQEERLWRIYGKDEDGTLIDSRFGNYPYSRESNGQRRLRPKEERTGPKMVVINVDYPDFYLVKTESNKYAVLARETIYTFYGNVRKDDILFLTQKQYYVDVENYTQHHTGPAIEIVYISSSYIDCMNWLDENVERINQRQVWLDEIPHYSINDL